MVSSALTTPVRPLRLVFGMASSIGFPVSVCHEILSRDALLILTEQVTVPLWCNNMSSIEGSMICTSASAIGQPMVTSLTEETVKNYLRDGCKNMKIELFVYNFER